MIRPFATELALFLAPFVIYGIFLLATRQAVFDVEQWAGPRVVWLIISALVLMIGSFVIFAQFGGAPPGSTYIPAHMEDGKFVPGETR